MGHLRSDAESFIQDEPLKLNLGCGEDVREGWINVDKYPAGENVMELNLEDIPWPWNDESATKILMDNVFEHLSPRVRTDVLLECHRILRSDGQLIMCLPVPEVGIGWDETHYSVPSWKWPQHPRWRDRWEVQDISVSKVGPGRFLTDSLARLCTRFWIARCIDGVTVQVTKQ